MIIRREREAQPKELEIGKGVPSGKDGEWAIVEISSNGPLTIWYDDGTSAVVRDDEEWQAVRQYGVIAIVGPDFIAKNADDYRWDGPVRKFGKMIEYDEYKRIIVEALGG